VPSPHLEISVRSLFRILAVLTVGCSTGPEEPLTTAIVRFTEVPSDADIAALEAVGGDLQHRIAVARSISMRADARTARDYAVVPGVLAIGDLGSEEDPDVSVFITTDGPPTEADAAFVRSAGARSAHLVGSEQTISAVMPLSRVADLEARVSFISVEISAQHFQVHHTRALSSTASGQQQRGSVFITYRADAPAGRRALVIAAGARSAHDVAEERTIAAVMPLAAAEGLRRVPWVDRVEVSAAEPLRPMSDLITWGIDSTRAAAVHATPGYRGSGVRIGVLDTRILCAHGDLRDRIAGGYDFVDGTSDVCGSGYYFGFPSHGTAVAGIIAGSRNGSGVLGVAPEAALYSLRVCDDTGTCEAADIWPALLWARKAGMHAINLSLGNCGTALDWRIADGLRRLADSRIAVIASAGNGPSSGCAPGSTVSSVASAPGVIGVAHWLKNGTQSPTFQYGAGIDLAAPAQVETADPATAVNTNLHSGTSFSAPHVTGAVALLVQAGFTGPDLILRRLSETAVDRGPAGWDDHWGAGTLDVARAAVARPFIASFAGTEPLTTTGSHTVTAEISGGAPPFSVVWSVSYSDSRLHAPYIVTGGMSHDLSVPAGRYVITVRATPRESVYGRGGATSVVEIPVCADAGGGGTIMGGQLVEPGAGSRITAAAGAC